MKRLLSLIVTVLILASGIVMTGCSSNLGASSQNKKLIDCLNLTKKADSMEGNLTMSTKIGGQAANIKMNIKIEDIHKEFKSKIEMDAMGTKQQFYLAASNGGFKMYAPDASGNYSATSMDASQLNSMDITKSFDAYVDVINKNPSMIKKIDDKTYDLNVPKNKIKDFYSKISGQKLTESFDKFKVEFVIGDDGYIQKVNVKSTSGSTDSEIDTDYFNYNKKFDIVLPNV